jgi:hypothetical protein
MTTASLMREVGRLKAVLLQQAAPTTPLLRRLKADPALILAEAGVRADPWQAATMRSTSTRQLILASCQVGKSLVAAGLALREALLRPGSLVLLLSPTQRQSGELFRDKVLRLYGDLGRPVPAVQETALTLTLANRSRIISLPGKEANIRGYSSVRLLILDEAARVPDPLFYAVRPMLSTSKGGIVCLSSAYAQLGFFYEQWTAGEGWERTKVRASDCPRVDPAFLEEERRVLGERWYQMEYEGVFGDLTAAVFRGCDIDRMLTDDVPLLPEM